MTLRTASGQSPAVTRQKASRNQLHYYPESRFGGFTRLDGTIAFYSRVNALVEPGHTVLDVGCGSGVYGADNVLIRRKLRILRGKVARVIGIDVDPAAEANPHVDEFLPITSPDWPIDSGSVHVVLADWALEHVSDPDQFFAECRRVLRTGGLLCLRTSNVMSYTGLATMLIPNRLHARFVRAAGMIRQDHDVYPTRFRCNTVWALRRQLRRHGFNGTVHGLHSEPNYLEFSRAAYAAGVLYAGLMPSTFAPALICFAEKVDS